MTPKQIDAFCTKLPGVTRTVQWKGVVVFKLVGTMFAALAPDEKGRPDMLCFKAPPEHFDTLSRSKGFKPVRVHRKWVALEDPKILTPAETKAYIRQAYAVIAAGLSKRKRAELAL
jgi:predicted DNA-binding protein (MmcQ/YjbR family)